MTDQQLRLVDTGNDSFEVVEADGRVSVTILTSPKDANDQYRIRYFTSTQEIYDETGKTVARSGNGKAYSITACGLGKTHAEIGQ